MKKRIYVEKKEGFRVEAQSLLNDFNNHLFMQMKSLRLINIYDIFNIEADLLEKAKYSVFGEIVTDNVMEELDLKRKKYLAVEYLPGQFDQRASSALSCLRLINPKTKAKIKSAKLLIFDDDLSQADLDKISNYYINKVESRIKNLKSLRDNNKAEIKNVKILNGFRNLDENDLESVINEYKLAMNKADLLCVIDYFKKENRDPFETELRILDTYWSDHCRHTTFNTELLDITIDESFISKELNEAYDLYLKMRKDLNREDKKICLMDMATISARYLKKHGYLDDLEESDENNACSIYVNVLENSKTVKWLLQFKNETHNHPTEIEPFGGASTCLGGAIRDPLSGRSYVYQAMRVTGSGDIYQKMEDTICGKLPQRLISTKAAQGYSSYGNQIGLATTNVHELYHDGYVAKRLEVGAVVGAVRASNVRREKPLKGDVVLMFGGRTGRDGIGGATGSSKNHNVHSIEDCSSEVQKGNAPEERKIEHLFRRKEVCKLIKKSNDFGAGGVSVAIGELADGLTIYLDRIPVKYLGLNPTELAISESQERMAVVVSKDDMKKFIKYCHEENLEVIHIADVTDENRLKMYYNNTLYVDLRRDFIDSAGSKHYSKCHVVKNEFKNFFEREHTSNFKEDCLNVLKEKNVSSQKGLVEMFDSTIGRSTVLMPYGGKYQLSETQVSCEKLPVGDKFTTSASIMAFGYDPYLSESSPFLGSQYAVIDAVSKIVAAGAKYNNIRFSFQEYFEKMNSKEAFGKPFESLLGAIKIQNDLKLPSIGGKDSMSGTFDNLHVPPMLMAFGITMVDAKNVISTDFKKDGNYIYLIKHQPLNNLMPNIKDLTENFDFINQNIIDKNIVSAYAVGFGGIIEALAKMSFGNKVGFYIKSDEDLINKQYGSIIVESKKLLNYKNAILLGHTRENTYRINQTKFSFEELFDANFNDYSKVYPIKSDGISKNYTKEVVKEEIKYPYDKIMHPLVYIPIFPGTNCDYDSQKAFITAGAKVKTSVFRNLTSKDVYKSILDMKKNIDKCNILFLAGGFSAGDEPDGSGKFIANILNNELIKESIENLIKRKGLILGICNGFQALIKSGLLPYGKLNSLTKDSPTLFRNDINRHVSQIVTTRVCSTNSPWLKGFKSGDLHKIAVSHGEGKFVCSEKLAKQLFDKGMVAFQYANLDGSIATTSPNNPNGSNYSIEGIVSEDGLILGKMGHSERYEKYNFKNIYGQKEQNIFKNAVLYFRKEN